MAVNTRLPLPDSYQSYLRRVIQDGGSYEQIPTVQFLDQYNKIMAYNPSLVIFPSAEKPGTLYTVTPNTSSADFTVTRASSGSYFDRNGILRTAVANEPRLDWNPITRQFNGVLIEPAATNLLLHSQDWTQAVWLKGGATIVSSTRVAPDGTSTGTELSDVGASSTPGVPVQSFNTTSTTLTFSIYTKAVSLPTNGRRLFLLRNSTTATNFDVLNFNYSSTGNLGNGWFSENVGNGWFRLSYTRTTGISVGNTLRIYYGRGDTAPVGATDVWQVWGAQVETNASLTSYIPTTATTGSRSADTITKTDASSFIGQTEGTVFAEFQYVSIASFRRIIAFQAGPSATNRIAILITNTNRLQVVFRANSLVYDISTTTTPLTGLNKIALCYRSGDFRLYLNGQAISTNTNAFSFTETLSNLYIGVAEFNTVDYYNGTIKSAALYTRALPDDQAINLTSL